jgi:hypothetical protein
MPSRRAFSAAAAVMSMTMPPIDIFWGLSRLVPRMVPPWVRMPDTDLLSSITVRFSISPRNPSRTPMTLMSCAEMAAFATPRIAAFNPGQSPPAVRIPMHCVFDFFATPSSIDLS